MQIRQLVEETEDFPTIATDATVADAARTMREADVRAVPVVEGDRLLGIVTDWDIVDAFSQDGSSLESRPVSSIMTSKPLYTIGIDDTAADATAVLRANRVHHLPVLDGERYRGMLCLGTEWTDDAMLAPPARPVLTARRP